ncbi:MAG: thermonuclease family protein [Rhodospirillaceae bacterium]|nr:thermonuclease family protein [Rhodospirillaceae bacterium]
MKTVLALCAALLLASPALAETVRPESIRVVDGDTLAIGGDKLRLLTIDAPETHKPRCAAEAVKGEEATARMSALIRNARRVEIQDSGRRDKYRRRLVDVIVDGRDAGAILMGEGLAVPWRPGRAAWQERYEHWCGR